MNTMSPSMNTEPALPGAVNLPNLPTSAVVSAAHLRQAQRSLQRLSPWIKRLFEKAAAPPTAAPAAAPANGTASDAADPWAIFEGRLSAYFPRLFELLVGLYGDRYDFFYHLEQILKTAATAYLARPAALHDLDAAREAQAAHGIYWFQSEGQMAGVCYVDRYAGNLKGIREAIPYFKEIGLTYLHLMPLFKCPEGNSDGGYAVSSFREVNPALGTMAELAQLATDLRINGISLCLDLVFNHTSDEHEWALRAKAGDPDYQDYYLMFPDRTLPDQYERTLREIFPEQAPGSFTFIPGIGRWVWTTFNTFQWDLNYANPEVFNQMLGEMLFLINQGVEVIRLDAVAFLWKQMGTTCENLPQAHQIIEALNLLTRITAPGAVFKSEAIVHPDEVAKYIGAECQLSYHPTLMVLLWEALATREVRLLHHTMAKRFAIPPGTAWVNYIRLHDDIGWSFANEDAAELGIDGYHHRNFLNQFYTGRFPGSFATGVPFNYNPRTGDMRISGSAASLCGLEKATLAADDDEIEFAIRRYLLIQGLTLAVGGIPLLYLNDELGVLNDYSYRHDPAHADDSRWIHRPRFDRARWVERTNPETVAGRIYLMLRDMIAIRKAHPAFAADGKVIWIESGNPHVFAFERSKAGEAILVLANFSEHAQVVERAPMPASDPAKPYADLIGGDKVPFNPQIMLEPYQLVWLLVP
jgi:amylosucrase